jgi:hypothetical protein
MEAMERMAPSKYRVTPQSLDRLTDLLDVGAIRPRQQASALYNTADQAERYLYPSDDIVRTLTDAADAWEMDEYSPEVMEILRKADQARGRVFSEMKELGADPTQAAYDLRGNY